MFGVSFLQNRGASFKTIWRFAQDGTGRFLWYYFIEVQFTECRLFEMSGCFIVPYRGNEGSKWSIFGLFVLVNRNYLRRNLPQKNEEQLHLWLLNNYFVINNNVVVHMTALHWEFHRNSRGPNLFYYRCQSHPVSVYPSLCSLGYYLASGLILSEIVSWKEEILIGAEEADLLVNQMIFVLEKAFCFSIPSRFSQKPLTRPVKRSFETIFRVRF